MFLRLLPLSILMALAVHGADSWTDISTTQVGTLGKQPWPTGCAGVVVNRLTGDVMVNFIGFGIWKSSDRGATWARVDGGAISGRGESGWSVQVDQNDPRRMAVFSLDGTAGYTLDGKDWKKFTSKGRNWDYGSVDWADPEGKVILVAKHESGGELDLSVDQGKTWKVLEVKSDTVKKKDECMVGVIDATTLIYSYANGIQRSTDSGATWTQVSPLQPRSKVPVFFKGAHYLCTSKGLIVSKDKGATWTVQGDATVDIWEGPFFGADEKTMVAAGPKGVFKTTDGGASWTLVSALHQDIGNGYSFSVKWFGTYAWDPINDVIYATAMAHPAFKNELGKK